MYIYKVWVSICWCVCIMILILISLVNYASHQHSHFQLPPPLLHFFTTAVSLLLLSSLLLQSQYPSNPLSSISNTIHSSSPFSLPHLAGIFCRPTLPRPAAALLLLLLQPPPPLLLSLCYRSTYTHFNLFKKHSHSLTPPKMNPHQQNKVDISVSFVARHLLWVWVEELTSSSFILNSLWAQRSNVCCVSMVKCQTRKISSRINWRYLDFLSSFLRPCSQHKLMSTLIPTV